jgi:hypothetical protein
MEGGGRLKRLGPGALVTGTNRNDCRAAHVMQDAGTRNSDERGHTALKPVHPGATPNWDVVENEFEMMTSREANGLNATRTRAQIRWRL